jgi:Cu-Zn family superoxide dismutase
MPLHALRLRRDGAARASRSGAVRRVVAVLALTSAASGCDTMKNLFSAEEPARAVGLEAPLSAVAGSGAQGAVRFAASGDRVTMMVALANVTPGTYRVLVHANGNCSSPNAFSAGPPWSPPGATPPLPERLPALVTKNDGTGTLTVRLAGIALEGPNGLRGKSVVVHDRQNGPFEAQPDVRNDRIACGVIGTLHTLF